MADSGIRFTDVLTNASTIASLKGDQTVSFGHLSDAIDVLTEKRSMEDFGPGVSPLLRAGRHEVAVDPAVRAFAQEWFARLGGDIMARLDGAGIAELRTAIDDRIAGSESG